MFEVPQHTDATMVDELRAQAARCRRLASFIADDRARDTLEHMAMEYDEKARDKE